MPRGETGKQRRTRIELGYYKRPDAITRWRVRLVVLTVMLAGLWFGLAPIWDRSSSGPIRLFEWDRLASPGPLARVHSTWESRCEACHIPFRPVNDTRWLPLASTYARVSDQQCQTCHTGPPHHGSQISSEVAACTECHRDHRGREASLARMEDHVCIRCHVDLNKHRDLTASLKELAVASSVTHFDANPAHHPEFAGVTRKDPGQLRFNHALHQATGFTLEPGGKAFTFAQIAVNERVRYGWTRARGLESPVPPLEDCGACHSLENDRSGEPASRSATASAVLPGGNAGTYMLPVTYENHCRACHPLEFDSKSPGKDLRHGLALAEVIGELRQYYAAQAVASDPERLRQFVPPRRKPGQPESPAVEKFASAIDDKVLTAIKILLGSAVDDDPMKRSHLPIGRRGCVECHHLSPTPGAIVQADAVRDVAIVPTDVNRVWYRHATFNHAAHRALACLACHAMAKTSENSSDVLLPGIANCVQCHGLASGQRSEARGGAGDSCTECHHYHDGANPNHGKGASSRGVKAPMSIESFLQGRKKAQIP
jgi:predicted CXXCH cytochrome family protein